MQNPSLLSSSAAAAASRSAAFSAPLPHRPLAVSAVDARLGQRSPALLAAVFHVAKSITAAAAGFGGTDLNQLLRLLQRECATLIAQAAGSAGGSESAAAVGAATLDAVSAPSSSSNGHVVCRVALVHENEIALRVTSSFAHRDAAAVDADGAAALCGADEAVVADRVFPLGRGLIGEAYRLAAVINVENPAKVRANTTMSKGVFEFQTRSVGLKSQLKIFSHC